MAIYSVVFYILAHSTLSSISSLRHNEHRGFLKKPVVAKIIVKNFLMISYNVFEIWIILENMAIVALFRGLDGIHPPGKSVS